MSASRYLILPLIDVGDRIERSDSMRVYGFARLPITDLEIEEMSRVLSQDPRPADADIWMGISDKMRVHRVQSSHLDDPATPFQQMLAQSRSGPKVFLAEDRSWGEDMDRIEVNTHISNYMLPARAWGDVAFELASPSPRVATATITEQVLAMVRLARPPSSGAPKQILERLVDQHPHQAIDLVEDGVPLVCQAGETRNLLEEVPRQVASRLLSHSDPQVRARAVRQLGQIGRSGGSRAAR